VKALSEKGSKSLALQKYDELALRAKFKNIPSWRIPIKYRSYMKTVSAFIPNNADPVEHHILGFKCMTPQHKEQMYRGIKQSFIENGCDLDDFEVLFNDD
jgi:hypothetical protein